MTFLLYILIMFLGLITAYGVEYLLMEKHQRDSINMINKMFDDAKKSMVVLITILSFGLIKFNDDNEDN